MPNKLTADSIRDLVWQYQPAAIILAGAELDLYDRLASETPKTCKELSGALQVSERGLEILLDALSGLGVLEKDKRAYRLTPELSEVLCSSGKRSMFLMFQHLANCLRGWSDLARTIKVGKPNFEQTSIRGAEGDLQSFIGAMDNVSALVAPKVVADLTSGNCVHILDVGGASGTWTIAWLRAYPQARATIFDLPDVIPMAKERIEKAGLTQRVNFVGGNYLQDELPPGADLAWLSAIVHQHSRNQVQQLYARAFRALAPGARLLIRDIVMEEDRTEPLGGAYFAVNMLVNTLEGGTFTLSEFKQDLEAAGFKGAKLIRPDPWMNAVIEARR